jgi:hypothetical protein
MAGVTATISITAFRGDWETHMPISALCERWTITKDQVLRLRTLWNLPLRNDRRLRFRPEQGDTRDPTEDEIKAACLEIQSRWDENTRRLRLVSKPQPLELRPIETPPETRDFLDSLNRECQW